MQESTTHGEYTVIETFTPEIFRFFSRFYITSAFFAVFFIGLVFVAWVPFFMVCCVGGVIDFQVLRAAVFCTATFLLLAALYVFISRELGRVRFIVSHEGIERRDPYRKKQVKWDAITGIRCKRVFFAKAYVKITTAGSTLLLPPTILHFDRLVEAIRRGVERAGRAALIDAALMRTMVAMGRVSERWNTRARAAFWPLVAATIGVVLFNSFVTSHVWETGTVSLIIWAGIGLPLPLLVYSIADIRLNHSYEKALLAGDAASHTDNIAAEVVVGLLAVAPFYGILGIIARGLYFR